MMSDMMGTLSGSGNSYTVQATSPGQGHVFAARTAGGDVPARSGMGCRVIACEEHRRGRSIGPNRGRRFQQFTFGGDLIAKF